MSELLELAARVEAAMGPDRDLEWRIAKELGVGDWRPSTIWPPFMPGSKADKEIPAYTASLDAARTLVPSNCLAMTKELWDGPNITGYSIVGIYEDYAEDCDGKILRDVREGVANSPALALVAAALRAREAASSTLGETL